MKNSASIALSFIVFLLSCYSLLHAQEDSVELPEVFAVVLGITQDAGVPQLGCNKACCAKTELSDKDALMVSCLAICDSRDSSCYLLDATPDIAEQMLLLNRKTGWNKLMPDGIFLTHAHIGHYTGLMYLGREAAGAQEVPVYAMPRMKYFLRNNGPWSMLDSLHYISLQNLRADRSNEISDRIRITAFEVPHRDEFSETVGFRVQGPSFSLVYIPDIDKWERWDCDIREVIGEVDFAFLDGTFYDASELPGRDMSEIPHPFISESMRHLSALEAADRQKIHFIHFNHTNPALKKEAAASMEIRQQGFKLAVSGQVIPL